MKNRMQIGTDADSRVPEYKSVDGALYGRKSDFVTEALLDLIATGQLRPGQQLKQDRLAHRLGTTVVPVREAFKTLISEGVLVHKPRRGHYVAPITSRELTQAAWLRDVLEDKLASTARFPWPEEIERMRALQGQIVSLADEHAVAELVKADRKLHLMMWMLSPEDLILTHMIRAWRVFEPYRILLLFTLPNAREASKEHWAMIDALEARDRKTYRGLIADHSKHIHELISYIRAQEAEERTAMENGGTDVSGTM